MQHDEHGAAPRRRKKHQEEEHEHPVVHDESNWLVSYADMMTLLFGFFVLMYSFSKVDQEKFEVVRKDMVKYFGGKLTDSPGAPTGIKAMTQDMETNLASVFEQSSDYNTQIQGDTLILTIKSDVLFPSGSATPNERGVKAIYKIFDTIKNRPIEMIEVEGHTDSDKIHTVQFPSNWELSTARASSIVRIFEAGKIDSRKLKASGFADSRPPMVDNKATGPTQPGAQGAVQPPAVAPSPEPAVNEGVVASVIDGETGKATTADGAPAELAKPEAPPVVAGSEPAPLVPTKGDAKSAARRVVINLRLDPKVKEVRKALEENGLNVKGPGAKPSEELTLEKRYEQVQAKMREAAERLAEAQAQERKMKELENLNKKTAELEKKLAEVQKKTQETLEKTQQPARSPSDTGADGK